MNEEYLEVDFKKYCKTCKHKRNWEKNSTHVMSVWIMDTISIPRNLYEVGGKEKMSYQYDRYLAQHKSNVEAGFRWLQKNLPKITEASGAGHNIVFAHDQSKRRLMNTAPMIFTFMEEIALIQ